MDNQKYYPKFKNLTFKNRHNWEAWKKENTTQKIIFKDKGQDLLEIWVDKGGEIIDCNLQMKVWNGMIIDLSRLKAGQELPIMEPEKMQTRYYDFIVERIENLKNEYENR